MINVLNLVLLSWGFYFTRNQSMSKLERMIRVTYDQAIEKIMPEVDSGSKEPFIIYRDIKGNWHVNFIYEQLDEKHNFHKNIRNRIDSLALMLTGEDFSKGSFSCVYDSILCQRITTEWESYKIRFPKTPSYMGFDGRDIEALINLFEDNVSEFSNNVMDHLTSAHKPLSELALLCPYKLFTYDTDFGYNLRFESKAIDRIEFNVYKRNHLNKKRTEMIKPVQPVISLSLAEKLSRAKEKVDFAAETKADYGIDNKTKTGMEVR